MKTSISIIFTIAFSVMLSKGSFAQNEKKQMVSFDKTSHSFGLIIEGEKVSTTFTLTNKGEKPISIIKASSTCGCTIPSYSKDPIQQGKKGTVELKFNSKGRVGAFAKSAIVKFSDGTQQVLKITGEVYKKTTKKQLFP